MARAHWQYFTDGLEKRVRLCFFDNAVIFFYSEATF
jgi:hypothetical protein